MFDKMPRQPAAHGNTKKREALSPETPLAWVDKIKRLIPGGLRY